MKWNPTLALTVILICFAAALTGCKRNGGGSGATAQKESKITGSPSDPPVTIEPKWVAGQRYIMRMESSQSYQLPNFAAMGRRGGGGGQGATNPPLQNNFAQEYALVVTNATDGQRGIEMEILGLELLASQGDQDYVNYDSRNKVGNQNGPMTELFDKLIGGKVYYLVGADNKVLRVEGINELFDRVEGPADANPGGRPGGGPFGGGGMLRSMYNEDLFKQLIEMTATPSNAVHVGETWTKTQEANTPIIGKLAVTTTNTLRGWQEHDSRKCARVEFTGGIVFSTNAAPNPLAAFMKLQDGTMNGNYWFATDLGIPIETVIHQELLITITIPNFGGGQRGGNAGADATQNTFSAPMKQNISLKLVEVKPISG
jgi:hypothetical protein